MKIKAGLLLFFLMASGGVCFANRDENMEPARAFFLPKGNVEAGKKTYSDLKCYICHQVENETAFPAPSVQKPGPVIGKKQAGYASGWIANSIVSPSHTIALNSNGEDEKSGLSLMGDFSEGMTVRQLIDLTAYIKSEGGKGSSK